MMIQKYMDWNFHFCAYIIIFNYFISFRTGKYTYRVLALNLTLSVSPLNREPVMGGS